MAVLAGILDYAVSAIVPSEFWTRAWPVTSTWFNVTFTFTILAIWTEAKAFRHCPKRETGTVTQMLVRHRANGKPIATVEGTTLVGASFVGVSLQCACLWGEDLSHGKFRGVNLRQAMLRAAILDCADLCGANLQNADLAEARFRDADLRGADLRNTFPRTADFTGAFYDQHTRWPKRFDPIKHGCIFVDGPAGLPIPATAGEPEEAVLPIPSASPQRDRAHRSPTADLHTGEELALAACI